MPSLKNLNLMERAGQERPRQFVRALDGPRLAYAQVGAGPDVVLIHGALTALEDMSLAFFDALRRSHRVIAFDRPGFGRSERRRFLDAGIFSQAERLWEVLDELEVERPILIGHSFGASVALAMAQARPGHSAGVVALAPLVFAEPRLEHLIFAPRAPPIAGDLVGLSAAASDKDLFPLLWRAMFWPQPIPDKFLLGFPFALAGETVPSIRVGEDAWSSMTDLARLSLGLYRCPTPVRVFGGDRDLVVRNGLHGRALAAMAIDGTFIDLPGVGHMAHHFAARQIANTVHELTNQAAPRLRNARPID